MCESNPLAGVPGVSVVQSGKFFSRYIWYFRFESSANANTAAAVVDRITGNRALVFSDRHYVSYAPASIHTICDAEAFLAYASRSHSTSAWAVVNREELVAYLTLCLRFNGSESEQPFHISDSFDGVHRTAGIRINRSEWASFRNHMAVRLGRPTHLQKRLQPYGLGALGARLAALWRDFLL